MCVNFIWRGEFYKVSWNTVDSSKKSGGLGQRNIKDSSIVCNLKLFWKFLNGESLWVRWMKENMLKTEVLDHASGKALFIHMEKYSKLQRKGNQAY